MYSAPLPQAFRPGDIGVIAQSGAVLLALGNANRMAGFSRLISSGNEAASGSPTTWTIWSTTTPRM